MVIADSAEVRRLCGNRSTDIISNTEIDEAIKFSDSFVKAKTSYTGWLTTDPDYEALREASENFAASSILRDFAEEEKKSQALWDTAMAIVEAVAANMANGGVTSGDPDTTVNIVTGEYLTFPKNPNVLYRRPNGFVSVGEGVAPEYRYTF